jgi:hypothetical protein
MFFAYPETATNENWVHECLIAMVKDVHVQLEANASPTKWPNCFPANHRKALKLRRSLKTLRDNYAAALVQLDSPFTRLRVLRCMSEQNEIHSLLSGASTCERLQDLPTVIRPPIEGIFEFGFDLIKELGIRDRHYCCIYDKMPFRDCPFCGTEPFDAPVGTQPRLKPKVIKVSEDLDHYLPRSHYPFAAANLRNLAPAGRKCNGVKSAQDPIRTANNTTCIAFDPYSHEPVDMSLIESAPFGASDGESPAWLIKFVPEVPECATWDRVYNIRERWITNDLTPQFNGWLNGFAMWAATRLPKDQIERALLIDGLGHFIEDEKISQRTGRERFRVKVMEMLHHHCRNGNERLLDFLKDLVEMAISASTPNPNRN